MQRTNFPLGINKSVYSIQQQQSKGAELREGVFFFFFKPNPDLSVKYTLFSQHALLR